LLVEVQALTAAAGIGLARRTAIGVDQNRLQLLVAVLSKRMGLPLATQDIYVNVVAGLKIAEPAVDLGVALAIASSHCDAPVDPGLVVVGEVGLLGELRPAGQVERRLAEAARLGFRRCILPAADVRRLSGTSGPGAPPEVKRDGLTLAGAQTVGEAIAIALGPEAAARGRRRPARVDGPLAQPGRANGSRFGPPRGEAGADELAFDDSIFDAGVE
jgi:DNA repair protein RadA/Sms